MSDIRNAIARVFNEYFPGPVVGDLPGYENALVTLFEQYLKAIRFSGEVKCPNCDVALTVDVADEEVFAQLQADGESS